MYSKKYIIATHSRVYGIPNALRDYLVEKEYASVLFISHPLDKVENESSFIEEYKSGKLSSRKHFKRSQRIGFINFFIDTILTVWWVMNHTKHIDIFIGVNNLNAFAGLILKRLGKVDSVIFYATDYIHQRFDNKLLNNVYHWIEKFAVENSDEVWTTSLGTVYARETYLNIDTKKHVHQLVPTGVWNGFVKVRKFDQIKKHQLFFIGHLLEKQGVQKVLEAIPTIIKEIKDFKFIVVGGGEYGEQLKKLTSSLKIEKYVEFTGIISDHSEVFRIMSESSVGIAPYKPEKDKLKNFTYFGDPGKIKDYLSVGLPVIMTDVSHNAKDLEAAKCAIIIDYDQRDIASAVIKMMKSLATLKRYRENALIKAKDFDWHLIFDKVINSV